MLRFASRRRYGRTLRQPRCKIVCRAVVTLRCVSIALLQLNVADTEIRPYQHLIRVTLLLRLFEQLLQAGASTHSEIHLMCEPGASCAQLILNADHIFECTGRCQVELSSLVPRLLRLLAFGLRIRFGDD